MPMPSISTLRTVVLVALPVLLVDARASAQGILASDDTWVREDQPDDNRNDDLLMNARTDADGDDNDVILLRFDTTSITGTVSGAELRLTWYREDAAASYSLLLYGLEESHAAETTWDEATVSYNTAPGLIADGEDPTSELASGNSEDEVQDLDPDNVTLLVGPVGYGPQVEGGSYDFSGAALDAFINADTNGEVTFLILRNVHTSGNQARFMTKENTRSDTFVVTGPEGFAGPRLFASGTPDTTREEIPATADTWVREDQPGDNRNADPQLNARTDSDADDNDVILLRFDTSSLTGDVFDVELALTYYRADETASRSLALYGLAETHFAETTWDEATVVYDDAPGLIPDGVDPATEAGLGNTSDDIQDLDTFNLSLLVGPVAYGPQVEGEDYIFSGAPLDAFINADTNGEVTFLIVRDVDPSGNQARFMTRESTSSEAGVITGPAGFAAPRLSVPQAIAPTPPGILASDDTWVREDDPTSNRDGDLQLNARTDSDADDNDVILLRFDTASITSEVTGAEVNLSWYRSDGTASRSLSLYGLAEAHPAEMTWDEATVVYDDAPGLIPDGVDPATEAGLGNTSADIQDLDADNLTLLAGPAAYGPQVEGEVYSFTGAALDAFINADTNGEVTFLVVRDVDASGNQARFMTKENTSSESGAVSGLAGFAGPRLVAPEAPPPPRSGILASDDTWVREDNPTSNRNDDQQMNARTDSDSDDNDVILLRFDTTTITEDAEGAVLELTYFRADETASRSLSLYGLEESHFAELFWEEATVVYNDAPGLFPDGVDPATEAGLGSSDDEIQDLDVDNLRLLVGPVEYGPQVEGNVFRFSGPALDEFINADTNGEVTFLILRDIDVSGNQARFMTKENTSSDSGVITGEAGFAGPRLIPRGEPAGAAFIRGDTDNSGEVNLTDGIRIFNFLFLGGPPPPCAASANTDGAGAANITSGVYLLNFLFLGGPRPPAPHPECGASQEPTDAALGCETPPEVCS